MSVRSATGGDAAALAVLERELFGADAWSEAAVASELTGVGRRAVVAEEADQLVGYAITMQTGDLADLQRIAVREDRRRRGVARILLGAVLADAAASGAEHVLLEVSAGNRPARAFYAAAGFVEIDRRRRYYRDGTDAVVMRRALGRPTAGGEG